MMGELPREEAAGAPLGWALSSQTLLKFCANALCKLLNSHDKAIRVSQSKATKLRMLKFQAKTEISICHEGTWTRLRPEASPLLSAISDLSLSLYFSSFVHFTDDCKSH